MPFWPEGEVAPVGEVVLLHEDLSLLPQTAGARLLAIERFGRHELHLNALRGAGSVRHGLSASVSVTRHAADRGFATWCNGVLSSAAVFKCARTTRS